MTVIHIIIRLYHFGHQAFDSVHEPLMKNKIDTRTGIVKGAGVKVGEIRYQHVGIPNAKFRVGGLSQRKDPTQLFLRRSGIYDYEFISRKGGKGHGNVKFPICGNPGRKRPL